MSRVIEFCIGDALIQQGDEDTVAYLIRSGWVMVDQKKRDGSTFQTRVGPGEIIGELALVGLVSQRSASAIAMTDGSAEVIDRGALIRLVNGPANKLTPVIAALLARLKGALVDEKEIDEELPEQQVHAVVVGLNDLSRQALCNQPCTITHLPWSFGAFMPPQSVTDLFRHHHEADIMLANGNRRLREQHLHIEAATEGLQLHLLQHGDYCEVDEERVGYGMNDDIVPLSAGYHSLTFGDQAEPYKFGVEVIA